MSRGSAVLALAVGVFSSSSRLTHAELPPNGERIRTHAYTIDLAQTPVLAGTRVTGLAGAFVAIGEGVDGSAQNPGAVTQRDPWSHDHVDYDLGLGVTFSSALSRSDVFNSGRRTVLSPNGEEALTFLNLAGNLQIGRWGFGISADLQEYSLDRSSTVDSSVQRDRLLARFAITHAIVGYSFHEGELLIGVGARSSVLDVVNENAGPGAQSNLFEASGLGFEAGMLLRPNDAQYRVGLCMRTAVTADASPSSPARIVYAGDPVNELYLPDHVTLPWELNGGFAIQFGPRPFNTRWIDPSKELEPIRRYLDWRKRERERRRAELAAHPPPGTSAREQVRALDAELKTEDVLDSLYLRQARQLLDERLKERYARMERFQLLVTASVDVLGAVDQGIGIESFLERKVQRSGRNISVSPRLGLESEVIPNWMRVRGGSYLEPSRFPDNPHGNRLHWTLGIDQRLFAWNVLGLWPEGSTWRVSGSLDVSRAYFSWGLAIGLWH